MTTQEPITSDMTVWQTIQQYPATYQVFRQHGCPDMRHGIYALSARFMKIRWAAKMHHISADALLRDLNRVACSSPPQAA